jgi:hypothetical protein
MFRNQYKILIFISTNCGVVRTNILLAKINFHYFQMSLFLKLFYTWLPAGSWFFMEFGYSNIYLLVRMALMAKIGDMRRCQMVRGYVAITIVDSRRASHNVYDETHKFRNSYILSGAMGDEIVYKWQHKPCREPIAFALAIDRETKMAVMETGPYQNNKELYLPNIGTARSDTFSMRILLDSNGGMWYSLVYGDILNDLKDGNKAMSEQRLVDTPQ